MSRGRLDVERTSISSVLEYFELRSLGNNHLAACARLGLKPKILIDRVHTCRRDRLDVPPTPEGLSLGDDWPHYEMPGGY